MKTKKTLLLIILLNILLINSNLNVKAASYETVGNSSLNYICGVIESGKTIDGYIRSDNQFYGYSTSSLRTKKITLKGRTVYNAKIINISRYYKSIKVALSNGTQYWYSISCFLKNSSYQIYNYQVTKKITCYKNASEKFPVFTYTPKASGMGTNSYDFVVLGENDNYLQVYKSKKVLYVKKVDLFTNPIRTNSERSISPANSNWDYFDSWYMGSNGSKQSQANVKLKKIGSVKISLVLSNKYEYLFTYNSKTGFYTIQNCYSKKMLDVKGGSNACGAELWQYNLDAGKTVSTTTNWSQQFQIFKTANGFYFFRSKLGTYIDLDNGKLANETNIHMWEGTGSNNQKWLLRI